MKILITGGAGYIGSIMVPELINKSIDITVVDNFMYKQSSLNHLCAFKNFNIINGDIRDPKLMQKLLKDHDLIIPLAAIVGAPLCNKDPFSAQSINHDANIILEKVSLPILSVPKKYVEDGGLILLGISTKGPACSGKGVK